MSIAVEAEPRIGQVSVTDDSVVVTLLDGRQVSVPLVWSWRLAEATPEQRARFEIICRGQGVRWPELDEDLSAEGMLRGVPARGGGKAMLV